MTKPDLKDSESGEQEPFNVSVMSSIPTHLKARKNAQVIKPNNGAFLKSLIKINNPDWSPEQIEEEFQKRLNAIENEEEGACIACSG